MWQPRASRMQPASTWLTNSDFVYSVDSIKNQRRVAPLESVRLQQSEWRYKREAANTEHKPGYRATVDRAVAISASDFVADTQRYRLPIARATMTTVTRIFIASRAW